MFVDVAEIYVKAGDGGDGCISFCREKYIPLGGPNGGDGGRGANIIFMADRNLNTLANFRYKKKFVAKNGENGRKNNCSGKDAEDLIIKVPIGTIIKDAKTNDVLADIIFEKETVIAKGGKGGFGNAHFANSIRQAPKFCKPGTFGQEFYLNLELKILADVGLFGLPNVGKSTFLSVISSAKPKIGNYNFTTLHPCLGVVYLGQGRSFVVADLPGLIEGASKGKGLGIKFLRHIERCRLLLHFVDVSNICYSDPIRDFNILNLELEKFGCGLKSKKQIIVASKADIASKIKLESLKKFAEEKGFIFSPISSFNKNTFQSLLNTIYENLQEIPKYNEDLFCNIEHVITKKEHNFEIERKDGVFFVKAPWLGKIISNMDIDDFENIRYIDKLSKAIGLQQKLDQMGIKEGDIVYIEDFCFTNR